MCLICRDLDKLTLVETVNNFKEMKNDIGKEHKLELIKLIGFKIDNEWGTISKKDFPEWDAAFTWILTYSMMPGNNQDLWRFTW